MGERRDRSHKTHPNHDTLGKLPMARPDFRHGRAATVAKALSSEANLSVQDLQAALANIAERVAIMEREWQAMGGVFAAFHDDFQRFLQRPAEQQAEPPDPRKPPR